MQNSHVLEIAIFKVKPECVENMVSLRAGLREALKGFPGLIEFCGYYPIDTGIYADIVKWDSQQNALSAAKAFESGDPRFLPYMNAIAELSFMGHFVPEQV